MTGTVVDALQDATAALNAATAAFNALSGTIQGQAQAAQTNATTVIENFLARPAVQTVFLDPLNGADTADGSTVAKAMKTLEAILAAAGVSATKVVLLNDLTIQSRINVNCALQIVGAQPSSTGYVVVPRTVSFLGVATNSPDLFDNWTFCAGLFLGGASFTTSSINFNLPLQPAGQTFSAHFTTQTGCTTSFFNGTLTVQGATSGQLFQAVNSKSAVFSNLALGSGAPGHLFTNVAAGADPNGLWNYDSNVTSA